MWSAEIEDLSQVKILFRVNHATEKAQKHLKRKKYLKGVMSLEK